MRREDDQPGWYFTAPWEPVAIRRGDALGFRAAADHFADLVAPGLTNGASDARWISLLSWCLKWSHVIWREAGGGVLSRRDGQRDRYAWLRPLELLWIDRALSSGQTTGQLRGRRSVVRWRDADRRLPDFAMSPEQFRRYRQVGTYGAYRTLLRTIPGLTTGDGWTPDRLGHELARLVNDALPRSARLSDTDLEGKTKWGSWAGGNESRYWIERGWKRWQQPGGLLPTPERDFGEPLPDAERHLLEPVLFAQDSTRRVTAEVLVKAKGARTHSELCDALASSSLLAKKSEPASLAPLPAFSRFADAAMHAMRALWNAVNRDPKGPSPAVVDLARADDVGATLDRARDAAAIWLRAPGRSTFRHEHVVTALAQALHDAADAIEGLRALDRHHQEHGGGRRWFREQAGNLVPLVDDTGIAASDYRMRLRPLSRLAAQCGVARMDHVLEAIDRSDVDDDAADARDEGEDDEP